MFISSVIFLVFAPISVLSQGLGFYGFWAMVAASFILVSPSLFVCSIFLYEWCSGNPCNHNCLDNLDGAEFLRSIEKSLQNRRGLYSLRMGSAGFGYSDHDGPATWGNSYPNCLGPYQSPVNIETDELEYREIKRPLKWSNLNKIPAYLNLEKTEVSLGMTSVWKTKWDIPYIKGGPLMEKYYFYHLHFHWNTSSNAGSEHSVNHKRFPMEIHVVYTTKQDGAPTENDKILVTGYMVTLTTADNPGFSSLIDSARKLRGEKEKQTSIPPFPFKILGLDFCEDYVIYSGSLTTPPCSSGITWIISSRPVPLSIRQYNTLKQVVSIPGQIYSTNARSVQKLNGRKIFYVVAPGCPRGGLRKETFIQDFTGDMFAWLENRVRICEALVLGSVLVLLVVFVDDYFGMSSALSICGPNVGFQFGYRKRNGPATWKEHYENALGEMQSPINIVTCDAVIVRTSPLLWSNHESVPEIMVMHNDGYSVTIQGIWKSGKPQITGLALDCVNYVFNRLYFHWGPTDTEGSEHTINYERYPLEVHAIYLKDGYNKLMDAHYDKCPNGILIIAFLFEIAPVDNPSFLHTVTENLFKIRNPRSHCYIEPFSLSDIFPEFGNSYFKYDGSITQPPCSEIVRYIIQTETIAVSRRQMAMFRKLIAFDGKPMVNNSRPVQKLNSRAVYYCYQ